ncbi:MAG: diacylglycerol/polyprenol kinase family protein [Candidatus Odinarchaeota archaeon]
MQIFPEDLALVQDITVLIIGLVIIFLVIAVGDLLKKKGMATSYFTRKLIHILVGTIYLLSWLFMSGQWFSPYIASVGPGLFSLLFFLIGTGIIRNEQFIVSMSRSGEANELLRGTFYYTVFMVIASLFFWSNYPLTADSSPVSVILILTLAFGDGLADVIGRKANRMKFKIFAEKSIPGTLTMLLSSLITSFAVLALFGYDILAMGMLTVIVILVATIVEACSPSESDNVTIPLSIIIVFVVLTPLLYPSAPWVVFNINMPS